MRHSILPWRMLVPIIVIMGLGLTLWSSAYLFSAERHHWHVGLNVESLAQERTFLAQWHGIEGLLDGMGQQLLSENHPSGVEFSRTAQILTEQNDALKGFVYFPSRLGSHVPLTYPNTAEMSRLQVKLERVVQKNPLPLDLAELRHVKDTPFQQELFLGQRLGRSGEGGILFVRIHMPTLFGTLNLNPEESLFVQITHQSQPLNQIAVQDLPEGISAAYRYSHRQSLSGADWLWAWTFSSDAGSGVAWLPSFLVLLIGTLMTLTFGWLIWMQQGVSDTVQQQVVERTNQLEQASRRFRLITDNAYDLIGISTIEGVLEYVNSAYHRVLGYSREELRGQSLKDLVFEKDVTVLEKALTEVAKGRNAVECAFRMRHKNGQWRYMEAVAKGLHDTDWTVKNTVIHCRDVTSRKQFADDLARSEQRFRDFADASADWLWEVDDKLRFTYVSPGVSKVLGYDSDEMSGNMQFDALFDKESDSTRDLIETRVQRHQPYRDIEFWTRSKEGERICLRISGVPVLDEMQSFSGYRGVATNITASKRAHDDMYRLATTDHLTGLLNRRRFMEELERSVSLARRHKTEGVLMFIDLDRFKEINDTHGHEAGDDILRSVTDILKSSFRSTDIIARLGGDEFAIIMHNISPEGAQEKVHEVIDRINTFEIEYKEARLSVTMSIGMVTYPQEDKDGDSLVMAADLAMYRAKDMGRNRVYIDDSRTSVEDIDSVRSQLKWVKRLRACLETGDFEMHYQPIVSFAQHERPLFEALLRIFDEEGKVGSPALYIDAAEHFGLIQQLDLSVVERCFKTQKELSDQGIDADFSVNLSSRSLGDKDVMQRIRELMHEYSIIPSHIMFEVTETMAIHDPSAFRELGEIHAFITELRRMGFRFAIDDFGAGFSSFNYIRQLPVDVVKIDGSFVKDVETSIEDRYFIESMVMLCKGLGIETIAEFVENENVVRILNDIGVDYIQGWQMGKPMPDIVDQQRKFSGKVCTDFITQEGGADVGHLAASEGLLEASASSTAAGKGQKKAKKAASTKKAAAGSTSTSSATPKKASKTSSKSSVTSSSKSTSKTGTTKKASAKKTGVKKTASKTSASRAKKGVA